ncbi:MAG: DUF1501 domain-containing protein [Acidimicrobiia bacterium]|nr:DUF1501 domain-containing protein [Acidimicrobiia bacterium]
MKDRYGIDWSKIPGTLFWRNPHIGRRMFFRHAASAIGGYFLLPSRPMETIARAQAQPIGKAKNCIFVLLSGGQSHIDTFDLKEGPWTPAGFNATSYDSIRFPQGIMPKIADQLDSIALLRSVRSWAAVHQFARQWAQIARNPLASTSRIAPHIGSVASIELSAKEQSLPTFLALNSGTDTPGSGYLPPQHSPFFVAPNGAGLGNTAHPAGPARFDQRYDLLLKLDAEERAAATLGAGAGEILQFNLSARGMMYNSNVDRVFTFNAEERVRYGNTGFGNACITARNLVRSGLGTRFIQITIGGWDNHSGIYTGAFNPTNQNSLIRQFDNGLGTLIADLKAEGLLEETLIVAMGEFGRTVGNLNAGGGRDHFLQQAVMFAGAGIRGPRAIGETDSVGRATTSPGWSRDRDIRAEDVAATIYSALGIDWTKIRRDDPLNRGFEYIPSSPQDLYGPVHEIWS